MSVLLTAAKMRAAAKPKSARPGQKKKKTSNASLLAPPLSNEKTSVWYWLLRGVPTTVMFSKDTGEIWCNGSNLETIEGFAEEDMNGANLDFSIELGSSEHKARIVRRVMPGKYRSEMVYMLFVDGFMVIEHTGQAPEEASTNISQSEALGVASGPTSPPSYEELYGNGAMSNGRN